VQVHRLHEIQVSQAPTEFTEQIERSVQWLNDESARILHALRHGEAIDGGGDAQEALGALQQVSASLDGLVESAELLWTWHDLFKVAATR
jgi:hypothetical protein